MTVVLYFYGHYLIGELRGKHEKLVREHDTRILMRTDIKKNYELIDKPRVEGANTDAVVCRRVVDMPIPEAPAEIQRCSYCDLAGDDAKLAKRREPRVTRPSARPLRRPSQKQPHRKGDICHVLT